MNCAPIRNFEREGAFPPRQIAQAMILRRQQGSFPMTLRRFGCPSNNRSTFRDTPPIFVQRGDEDKFSLQILSKTRLLHPCRTSSRIPIFFIFLINLSFARTEFWAARFSLDCSNSTGTNDNDARSSPSSQLRILLANSSMSSLDDVRTTQEANRV